MEDNFFQVFLDVDLKDKAQVFDFIADQANAGEKDALVNLLISRETIGSTSIADRIILPHLESPQIKKSQILFIKLREELNWDDKTGKVKMAVVILLKKNEEQAVKQKIGRFTRTLADEAYLEELLSENDVEKFSRKIRKF